MEYYGTLGPSCCKEEILIEMIHYGMNGIRLNLSHKSLKDSEEWIFNYLNACKKCNKDSNLLIDLQGPELRINEIKEPLNIKDEVYIGEDGIPINNELFTYLKVGQIVLIDDGKIKLEVKEIIHEHKVLCNVLRGGILTSKKSIAFENVETKQPTLTKQDVENLKLANTYQVKDVMLPFVRNKQDLINLRNALKENHCEHIRIFAKIENKKGFENVKELIPYSDVIVIARGDLGNAYPLTYMPVIQDQIANMCKQENKDFMVVTQMLNSMIHNAVPTRAEVNDIYHAIEQGASSIMLTGETAMGEYPIEAMKVLIETGEETRKYLNK